MYEEVEECDEVIGIADSVARISWGRGHDRTNEKSSEPRSELFAGSEVLERPRQLLRSECNFSVLQRFHL